MIVRARNVPAVTVRCAIYSRKSTSEGLDSDFNTLDAQREACEAYVLGKSRDAWESLPAHYDDGGYSGGDMERPALKALLADIEAGKIDVVVVYKIDRLSRSLIDFAKMMAVFEKHGVSCISISQQFDTTTPIGRLTLHMLLSFAQFERELIAERTRDKMSAARRKGKWCGGRPFLGYDIDPATKRLEVNAAEAEQVRAIFGLYIERGSILDVLREVNARCLTLKAFATKAGGTCGGGKFDRGSLHALLTNVTYTGKIRYRKEVHQGEHEPIVDAETFSRVQELMRQNRSSGASKARTDQVPLLRGLLYCKACGKAMSSSYTSKRARKYRYYVCNGAAKKGWATCPSKSVPAAQIEQFVVGEIKAIGSDPALVSETIAKMQANLDAQRDELRRQQAAATRELGRHHDDLRRMAAAGETSLLADLQERIATEEGKHLEARDELAALKPLPEIELRKALAEFEPVWASLSPSEQAKLLNLLLERIDYDGAAGSVTLRFWPNGFQRMGGAR
jgi:site-specific DNA recombinase